MSLNEQRTNLVKWKLKQDEFVFTIEYKKRKKELYADELRRIEIHLNETRT